MCAKHYENPTMLSRVTGTAKNVGDVFFETHCIYNLQRTGPKAGPHVKVYIAPVAQPM